MNVDLRHGDCLEVLRTIASDSIDAVVTDPPYGLAFMGKRWDYGVPAVEVWAECLRVLKPGGHLLAFAGTRTQHRMAVRIEDAGFEIRDMIAWVYGSGFPKSLDVSKAIDKAAGAEREVLDSYERAGRSGGILGTETTITRDITAPATDAARQWDGWGTALKPALEPITMARKPLAGTVAENVLAHGTGAINVDGCRVGSDVVKSHHTAMLAHGGQNARPWHEGHKSTTTEHSGRWPANLIHDGSDEVVGLFPQGGSGSGQVKVSSGRKSGSGSWAQDDGMQRAGAENTGVRDFGDTGSAARFFYCAKASKADRDEGCYGFDERPRHTMSGGECIAEGRTEAKGKASARNHHPTVKPTALMRYLCRLVTPPGGVVLDPFTGSGSTGKAAVLEGFRFLGIEREAEYVEIARARIASAEDKASQPRQETLFQEAEA